MESLEYGKYYHIYNRGINGESLFLSKDNFEYFLRLYDKYIPKIAETFAWCLMNNHFHFLVKIKERKEVKTNNPERFIYQQFSNLFNAYTKAFNKKEDRHGALFERPFRRKHINSEDYLKKLVLYIHTNPVHHKIVENSIEYPWTSYLSIISLKKTKVKRNEVLGWFDTKANFIFAHQQKTTFLELKNWY